MILVRAIRNFKVNNFDVKIGDIFEASEEEGVIVNKKFCSQIGSPFFESSFEIIETYYIEELKRKIDKFKFHND